MSFSQITLEDVVSAELDVLDIHAVRLSYVYGPAAVERMVNLPPGGLDKFITAGWRTSSDTPRPIYDLGYCHAANAFRYAWLGTLEPGFHADDLVTDIQLIAQFVKQPAHLETHDSQDFSYAKHKGMASDEIIISLASAAHARFAAHI